MSSASADGAGKDTQADELKKLREQLGLEKRRADGLAADLKAAKEQYVTLQTQLEQEEEAITNKLMKRLDQLKREKAEMEAEEEMLTSTLEKRLEQASKEQAAIVARLHRQLEQLKSEKAKLYDEKISLENHLEAEQEFIMNKLQKQVEKARQEKVSLALEKSDLARQVSELALSTEKLKQDKINLEQEMEAEEELITNKLQRQVDALLVSFWQIEAKLQAKGSSLAELGITPPAIEVPGANFRLPRRSSGNCSSLGRNSSSNIYGVSPGKSLPLGAGGMSLHASGSVGMGGSLHPSGSLGGPSSGSLGGGGQSHGGQLHGGVAMAMAAAAAGHSPPTGRASGEGVRGAPAGQSGAGAPRTTS